MTSRFELKGFSISIVICDLANLLRLSCPALAASLFLATPAWAVGSVLSGAFDGSETVIAPLVESECAQNPMGISQSVFQVSESGTYSFKNVFGQSSFGSPVRHGVGVVVLLYQGSFSVSNPELNLVAPGVFSQVTGETNLISGTPYVLVVQQWCWPDEGTWAVAFTGPGSIISNEAMVVPSFTSGAIQDDAPIVLNICQTWWDSIYSRYRQSGPVRVSRDGAYYFSDAGNNLCLSVYTAPVEPNAPFASHVASTFGDPINLHAGQDYYFVVQIGNFPDTGDYFYVLAPPAPFRINAGLADTWYNAETPGQGFFLDVYEQLNRVFLGWFTYSDEPAADDKFAHRWMTATGPFSGTSAKLAIGWTSGGAFDAAQPAPQHVQDGTIELEFFDCWTGQIRYAWGGEDDAHPAVSGVIPIERVASDSVALCESLYRGPGTPGPL